MPKYRVLVTERYFLTECREVEANSEDEARELAEAETAQSWENLEFEDVESYVLEPEEMKHLPTKKTKKKK